MVGAMARKQVKFRIDKLKICYKQPPTLYKEVAPMQGKTIDKGYFKLFVYEADDQHAFANIVVGHQELGILTLNNSKQCEGLCFFKFSNKALYTDGCINQWETIANTLGLALNNITELEIACDSSINIHAKVRKAIKHHELYDMFVNGRKVHEYNRKIEGYLEHVPRSRQRMLYNLSTIYISQKKQDGPVLRVYNKSEEIQDNNHEKDYIVEDFKQIVYRTEIRLKSNSIKEFLKYYVSDETSVLAMVLSEHFLSSAWSFFADRLLFFRDKQGNDIAIADLLKM